MNREEQLQARLRWLIETRRQHIIQTVLANVLYEVHPSWPQVSDGDQRVTTACINRLRNATFWHVRRLEVAQRLENLRCEMERLMKRSKGNRFQEPFLQKVQTLLWLDTNPPWADIEETLELSADEQELWHDKVRLALAQAVLNTLAHLYETQALQANIDKKMKDKGGYRLCL